MGRPLKELAPDKSVQDLIGWRIRKLRMERKWGVDELAAKVFVTPGRITQVETANDPPGRELTKQLAEVLGAQDLVELWPLMKLDKFRDYAQLFLRDQAVARTIHEFSPVVPGLLQVADYSRALMGFSYPTQSADLEDAVIRRMERKSIFERTDPPWLWVVIAEGALTQVQGSPEVMVQQIDFLLEMTTRRCVNIQILPLERASVPESISLLSLPGGEHSAYTEGYSIGTYYREPEDVERQQTIYDRLQADALSTEASIQAIRDIRRKHR
ncbi:helix-turn-helix transcriptional regulator [Streptomyces sp. NPDC049906]|uniref:helix-turn-helix domain-containing protein n=1 Tax=Streptomyces sp. NPDC049906 TaxID=3155656 RepID=UPI00341D1912